MSFLSKIFGALGIGHANADTPSTTDSSGVPPTGSVPPATGAAPSVAGTPVAGTPVDVTAKLEALSAQHPGLNWRTSIVDLLKLLGIDSDLAHRKELATELGYTGATDGSAEMNNWLHKAVLTKISQNGGTVPAELL